MGYYTDNYKLDDVLWKTRNVTVRIHGNLAAIA